MITEAGRDGAVGGLLGGETQKWGDETKQGEGIPSRGLAVCRDVTPSGTSEAMVP